MCKATYDIVGKGIKITNVKLIFNSANKARKLVQNQVIID